MMLPKQLDKSSKLKIAVLRANALGDFIFALPAFEALHKTYPNAGITLLGKKWHKDFLENRPSHISNVIVIPPFPGIGKANDFIQNKNIVEKFFSSMKKEQFDIAIQLHGGGKFSNPFMKKIGASFTIGLKTSDAISLDETIPYIYYQNEYTRYLEVVRLIGATTNNLIPHLSVTPQDIQEVTHVFPDYKMPFVVLHPGASDMRRRWSPANFAQIGDYLVKKGLGIVITGSTSEKIIIDNIIAKLHNNATNLCGKLSLSGLTGLLHLADLVVSNDTGPFHLSYALGTPTIGIFWCGNMINGAPLTREKIRTLISWITHCPMCGADCSSVFPFQQQTNCKHETSFVIGVSVEEVEKTINEMFTTTKKKDLSLYGVDTLPDYSSAKI